MNIDSWLQEIELPLNSDHLPTPPESQFDRKGKRAMSEDLETSDRSDGERIDVDATPKAGKKRKGIEESRISPSRSSSFCSSHSSLSLKSHRSGRMSPLKQVMSLEHLAEPVLFSEMYPHPNSQFQLAGGFASIESIFHVKLLRLSEGIGIIGLQTTEEKLSFCSTATSPQEELRFSRPDVFDCGPRFELGTNPDTDDVNQIVVAAQECNAETSDEGQWNEAVHRVVLALALKKSTYCDGLVMRTIKSAKIDPPELAPSPPLPTRIIDYAIALKPDSIIQEKFDLLEPAAKTSVKSWNHITQRDVRRYPICIGIETKAPYKSWTDGLPQLGGWAFAMFKRLQRIGNDSFNRPYPPYPLVIAQGHDWFLLFACQALPPKKGIVVLSKLEIGGTSSPFSLYKLVAVLQCLFQWAERVWRPFLKRLT